MSSCSQLNCTSDQICKLQYTKLWLILPELAILVRYKTSCILYTQLKALTQCKFVAYIVGKWEAKIQSQMWPCRFQNGLPRYTFKDVNFFSAVLCIKWWVEVNNGFDQIYKIGCDSLMQMFHAVYLFDRVEMTHLLPFHYTCKNDHGMTKLLGQEITCIC